MSRQQPGPSGHPSYNGHFGFAFIRLFQRYCPSVLFWTKQPYRCLLCCLYLTRFSLSFIGWQCLRSCVYSRLFCLSRRKKRKQRPGMPASSVWNIVICFMLLGLFLAFFVFSTTHSSFSPRFLIRNSYISNRINPHHAASSFLFSLSRYRNGNFAFL